MSTDLTPQHIAFFIEIKERIRSAQYEALKAVNKELIGLYWDIGKSIVEKQEQEGWGKSIVELLSNELQAEFPGVSGFSARNLWRMRAFYNTYKNNAKLPPLVAEIGWAHNCVILERCKDDLQREYYIQMTRKFGWTKNILNYQIDNQSYEKFLINQTNFDGTVPEKYKRQAKLAVKDEYTFDFLELDTEYKERELEAALVNNIRRFLLEMGDYFTFVGHQYRLTIEDDDFYIDLLLYHRKLRCLIAIELKTGKFKPEYAGKMSFYLSALDDLVRLEDENPSIGIIICQSKNRTVVEYSLRDINKPMGISTYRKAEALPADFQRYLPAPKDIANRLKVFVEE